MKKVAAFLMLIGAATLVSGIAVQAQPGSVVPPTAEASPDVVAPGGAFTVTVTGCESGETVTATLEGQSGTGVCGAPTASGFVFAQAATGVATIDLTAPAEPGAYTGTATMPSYTAGVPFTITVQTADTTTTAPTTIAPTTTARDGELPSTGSNGIPTIAIAAFLLVAGAGLFYVSRARARQVTPR